MKRTPKILKGVVVSNKMQNTIVVEVSTIRKHPKYEKRFRIAKKYHAHTDQQWNVGDKITIQETRPISKTKKWKVIEIRSTKSE